MATSEWRHVAVEGQCERLIHELTLLSLWGSELCMSVTGIPSQAPLHEGMCFAIAQHTEVAIGCMLREGRAPAIPYGS
jgi:hypothetical protein